jgi:hypothetical protein
MSFCLKESWWSIYNQTNNTNLREGLRKTFLCSHRTLQQAPKCLSSSPPPPHLSIPPLSVHRPGGKLPAFACRLQGGKQSERKSLTLFFKNLASGERTNSLKLYPNLVTTITTHRHTQTSTADAHTQTASPTEPGRAAFLISAARSQREDYRGSAWWRHHRDRL